MLGAGECFVGLSGSELRDTNGAERISKVVLRERPGDVLAIKD